MAKIVLTADSTLMSEYNKHMFLGFAACSPKLIPRWLHRKIFCPPVEQTHGIAQYAPCGTRKIEAALLDNGFSKEEVVVAHPLHLSKTIDKETKAVGITTNDPLGGGPASTTFIDLVGRESYSTLSFKRLLYSPLLRKHHAKIIVGGPGAWQLENPHILTKFNIDCLVLGEGELSSVNIFEKALEGEKLPQIVHGEVVPREQIPIIKNPTINGIVEIARGCGRGCRFCNPTMLNYRCQPLKRILKEVKLNVEAGNGALLHAEDVLRYKAKGFVPEEEEVVKLFEGVRKVTPKVYISHFALSSVATKPTLIERISDIVGVGGNENPWMSGQTGIETGSSKIIERHMKGKVKPWKPEEWCEVVLQAHKILKDNHWVPCSTLIFGLPGEDVKDVELTNELIYDLREYKSLIVPLFFVSIGKLRKEKFFRTKHMLPEHWQLMATCWRHNFRWVYELMEEENQKVPEATHFFKEWVIKKAVMKLERGVEPYIKVMEEGENPFENVETKWYKKVVTFFHQFIRGLPGGTKWSG